MGIIAYMGTEFEIWTQKIKNSDYLSFNIKLVTKTIELYPYMEIQSKNIEFEFCSEFELNTQTQNSLIDWILSW